MIDARAGARNGTPDRGGFDSVVILSPYFWNFRDDMWQTTHHVARQFARRWPTLLVEPAPAWNPWSEQFRLHRLLRTLLAPRTETPLPDLVVFHRRGRPFGRTALVRDRDLARNAGALRGVIQRLGFRRPLLWHSFPYWTEKLREAIDHGLFVYHCLDHSSRHEETALVRAADVVLCVSNPLVEKHRQTNPRTYLLPNGVDLDLFSAAPAAQRHRPGDLPARGRLIGFVGSINCHVALDMLVNVARAFPNDSLVLVGRVLTNETAPRAEQGRALEALRRRPNVRLLGFKPTRELPSYIEHFDVCLIPFLRNQFNEEADPLKFYQYLALGKPVVTTPVPVAGKYRDLCYTGESPAEFVAGISRALKEDSMSLREARLAVARTHSWPSIVERACRIVSNIRSEVPAHG